MINLIQILIYYQIKYVRYSLMRETLYSDSIETHFFSITKAPVHARIEKVSKRNQGKILYDYNDMINVFNSSGCDVLSVTKRALLF